MAIQQTDAGLKGERENERNREMRKTEKDRERDRDRVRDSDLSLGKVKGNISRYSGIRIKSTPRDRKKLLTLSKVDFIQFQGRKPKYY